MGTPELAPIVTACPNIRAECCVAEHAHGKQRCNLLLDKPKRCPWAERGPALTNGDAAFKAYLKLAGGQWWGTAPKHIEPPKKAEVIGSTTVPPEKEPPSRLCGCGQPREPRKRYCETCRRKHRNQQRAEEMRLLRARMSRDRAKTCQNNAHSTPRPRVATFHEPVGAPAPIS